MFKNFVRVHLPCIIHLSLASHALLSHLLCLSSSMSMNTFALVSSRFVRLHEVSGKSEIGLEPELSEPSTTS
jgi:hypothetical protein